MDRLTHKWH